MKQQDSDGVRYITYHFVWQPTRAKACLTDGVAERLQELVQERSEELRFEPITLLVLPDRVYLAALAPPTLAPHSIVCQVKALTARTLREEFPQLTRIPALWTRAYLVLAGDSISPEEVLKRYEELLPPRRGPGRPPRQRSSDPSSDDNEQT